jgi:hypothetical protein
MMDCEAGKPGAFHQTDTKEFWGRSPRRHMGFGLTMLPARSC